VLTLWQCMLSHWEQLADIQQIFRYRICLERFSGPVTSKWTHLTTEQTYLSTLKSNFPIDFVLQRLPSQFQLNLANSQHTGAGRRTEGNGLGSSFIGPYWRLGTCVVTRQLTSQQGVYGAGKNKDIPVTVAACRDLHLSNIGVGFQILAKV
jgi:hypothetical protein